MGASQAANRYARAFGTSRSDALLTAMVFAAVAVVIGAFGWLLLDLLRHGAAGLSWSFLTESVEASGRSGGIGPVVVSTLLILGVCMAAAIPAGLLSAIWLSEFARTSPLFGHWVRRSLDVLAGVPSIVFGLFGNAFFCVYLGLGFSILSGGLTLACMVLPIFVREAEEGLRAVPQSYRLASAALGFSQSRTLFSIVLPAAIPGVLVGLVLGVGRALAETAALIFTSGYVTRTPDSLLDSGRSLSIHIYDLSMNVPGGEPNAYTSALVLVALLVVINTSASWASSRFGRARRAQ